VSTPSPHNEASFGFVQYIKNIISYSSMR